MNRRRLVGLLAIAPVIAPHLAGSAQAPIPVTASLDFAEARFFAAGDDGVRSLFAQVSRWPDARDASRFGVFHLHQAGSDLPEGEFYQSEPVDLDIPPDRLAPPAAARGWTTTVGAAAYTTDLAILVVQRDTLLWAFRISGAMEAGVLGVAIDLAATLVAHDPNLPLVDLLPTAAEVPPELYLDSVTTPDGVTDADGTPWP